MQIECPLCAMNGHGASLKGQNKSREAKLRALVIAREFTITSVARARSCRN